MQSNNFVKILTQKLNYVILYLFIGQLLHYTNTILSVFCLLQHFFKVCYVLYYTDENKHGHDS